MKHSRRQIIMSTSVGNTVQHATHHPGAHRFSRLVKLWVPAHLAKFGKENIAAVLDDVNAKIIERGYIEPDGQMLLSPLHPEDEPCMVDDWGCSSEADRLRRTKLYAEGLVAGVINNNAGESVIEVESRMWGREQHRYFGRANPYQLCEEPGRYSYWHVQFRNVGPYLSVGERIVALLHGVRDDANFYCPCHNASVVYTTKHRFICMECGFLHAVPETPLQVTGRMLLTDDEWYDYFDPKGARTEQEVDLALLDFQEIENKPMTWTTSQWEDACGQFIFLSRSSPEEISAAIRGTEMDASILLNAGWQVEATPLPVAQQIAVDSVNVDLLENAMIAFEEGVHFYIAARTESVLLVTAVPALFRSVELLLKERLVRSDASALADQPNNPTVLTRLKALGVRFKSGEESAIGSLRRMRNNLQHGTAKFNHRVGLAVCREVVVFVNRFLDSELGLFIGDHIHEKDWIGLLSIPEIAATNERVVAAAIENIRDDRDVTIERCLRCKRDAMVRLQPNTGVSCWYCGHCPVEDAESL